MENQSTYTVFDGPKLILQGSLSDVIVRVKKRMGKIENSSFLICNDSNGQTLDFNFQGSEKDVLKRLETFVSPQPAISKNKETVGPGRPKLGVVAREVSLLPRHWEWLALQEGGASVTIRKLVDEAKKKFAEGSSVKQAQERVYKFMSVMAGDLEGYEEALRALYKKDAKKFALEIQAWPEDIKKHTVDLSKAAFEISA